MRIKQTRETSCQVCNKAPVVDDDDDADVTFLQLIVRGSSKRPRKPDGPFRGHVAHISKMDRS